MGRRKLSAAELERRGSVRAIARKKEEAASPKARARLRRAVASPERRSLPRTRKAWRTLCRKIPGYDPWALAGDCRFDTKRARAAIDWIETHCRHIKGKLAGQLLRLEDFQRAIVANLFGWIRPDGTRRYRKSLIYLPRKNAKTTLAAAIVLYVFFEDGEPGAEVYSAAAKRDQAKIIWKVAKSMIAREPRLDTRCTRFVGSILLDDEESFFQPLASEGKSEHGHSTSMGVVDELHAQANPDMMEALETSTGAREQYLLLFLTTADSAGESVCNDELQYAQSVRDNGGDPDKPGFDAAYLPVIYAASNKDDWTDPEVWRRVNPLYDSAASLRTEIAAACRSAQDRPNKVNAFRRWHLNVTTETAVVWLRQDHWDACAEPFDPAILEGASCWMGIDLSTTTDMTSVVALFQVDDLFYLLPHYWVPEEAAMVRDRSNDPLYKRWSEAGHLTLTEGNAIDYEAIWNKVDDLAALYTVLGIGIDPAFAMQTALELQKRGHRVEMVRQGWVTMSEPCNRMEVLLAKTLVRHGGHPVLRWNALNTKVKVGEHGQKAPVKPKDAAKIDGMICALMALRLATVEPAPKAEPRIRSLV